MRLSWFLSRMARRLTSPSSRRASRPKAPHSRPRLEALEGRDVPATVSWINASGGDWDTASNWSTGAVPGASDDVVLNVPGSVTITHSTGTADAVRSISGTDTLILSSGSLSVSSNSDYTGAVTLSGATLTGGGNLEFDGAFTWNGGVMSGTGTTLATGTVLLNPTTQFFQTGLTLDGRTFENAKAATWVGGNISTGDGADFENLAGATLTIETDATFDSNFGSQATFQNAGTVSKSLTVGTTYFNTLFDNTGAVTVKTGTMNLNGGGNATGTFKVSSGATLGFTQDQYTLEAASQVSGAGTVQFLDNYIFGGSTYNLYGTFDPSKTVISNGTVNFDANTTLATLTLSGGTIGGTGNLTVTGPLNWTGGTISGTGTTTSNGALLIETANATPTLSGGTFENDGTATLTGSGTFQIENGALFDNPTGSTFSNQGDATIGSSSGTFDNEGTFKKTLTTGTTTLGAQFNNTGTVSVQTGTVALSDGGTSSGSFAVSSGAGLNFTGGNNTLSSGSRVTGAGAITFQGGTTDVLGTYSSTSDMSVTGGTANFYQNLTLAELTESGGTLYDAGNVTIKGALTWNGGTMSGPGVTLAKGGVTLNGGGFFNTPTLDGRTFENTQTVTWIAGNVSTGDGAIFDNMKGATFDIETDATFDSNFGSQATFQNEGTVTKSLTTGTTQFNTLFNSTGTTNVQTGTVILNGGGTSSGSFAVSSGAGLEFTGGTDTLSSGSSVTGAGAVTFQGGTTDILGVFAATSNVNVTGGTVNFYQNLTLPTLIMSGGTLYDAGNVTISGLLNWEGGTMTGPGVTLAAGGVTLNGGGFFNTPTLDGRTFENAATVNWIGGNVSTGDGAIFDNLAGATFDIQTDATFDSNFGQQSTFQNAGAITKSLTTGITYFNPLFDNTGTVDVQTGTVAINGGGSSTGSFTAESGAILDFSAGTTTLAPASTVGGAGTVQFGSVGFFGGNGGTTNLEGTFAPANVDVIGGTVNFTTNQSLANLMMSGGTLTGPSTVTVSGPLDWTGGTMSGSGTTIAAGGLTIDTTTGGNPNLSTRTFQNAQVGTLIGNGGTFAVSNTGVFDNTADGTLTIQGSVSFGAAFFQGPGTVQNEGTLTLSGTGNTVTVNETFATSGTINLGGNALNTSGTYTQTAGTTNLQGGTLTAGGTGVILGAAASLIGPGTVNANVANSGLVDPGSAGAPGQLTINGNYSQSGTGTLQIQLGGTTAGSGGYDQLVVNGAVALDGTLSVVLVNGFVPQSGQQFQFLTDSSESGTFATDLFPVGVNFQVTYGSNGVTLTTI